jgi:hypothetical protein
VTVAVFNRSLSIAADASKAAPHRWNWAERLNVLDARARGCGMEAGPNNLVKRIDRARDFHAEA